MASSSPNNPQHLPKLRGPAGSLVRSRGHPYSQSIGRSASLVATKVIARGLIGMATVVDRILSDVSDRWVRTSGGHEVEATVEPLQTRCQFAVQVVDMKGNGKSGRP